MVKMLTMVLITGMLPMPMPMPRRRTSELSTVLLAAGSEGVSLSLFK